MRLKLGDLRNCPFCGSDSVSMEHGESDDGSMRWFVFCASCGVETAEFSSEFEAQAGWNRRFYEQGLIDSGIPSGDYSDDYCALVDKVLAERRKVMHMGSEGSPSYIGDLLKAWSEEVDPLGAAVNGFDIDTILGDGEVRELFDGISRLIDQQYIRRPFFEDGSFVQFGDSAKRDFGTEDAKNIERITFTSSGSVDVSGSNGHYVSRIQGKPFQKTQDPSFDVNGNAIHVGDVVWALDVVDTSHPWVVENITNQGLVVCRSKAAGDSSETLPMEPAKFSHAKPVFDADGIHVLPDDSVWHKLSWKHGIVDRIDASQDTYLPVLVCFDDGEVSWCAPHFLTHNEPDTHEKLFADVSEYASSHDIDDSPLGSFVKRYLDIERRPSDDS